MTDTLTVTYACGHTGTVPFRGNARELKRAMWRYEHQICDECAAAKRREANTAAAAQNSTAGLPELTGSEKQVAWAETIRADMFESIEADISRVKDRVSDGSDTEAHLRAMEEIARMFRDETDAGWFISERNSYNRTFRQFVRVAMERDAEEAQQ